MFHVFISWFLIFVIQLHWWSPPMCTKCLCFPNEEYSYEFIVSYTSPGRASFDFQTIFTFGFGKMNQWKRERGSQAGRRQRWPRGLILSLEPSSLILCVDWGTWKNFRKHLDAVAKAWENQRKRCVHFLTSISSLKVDFLLGKRYHWPSKLTLVLKKFLDTTFTVKLENTWEREKKRDSCTVITDFLGWLWHLQTLKREMER